MSSDWDGAIVVNVADGRRAVDFLMIPEFQMGTTQKNLVYDAFLWAASRVP